MDLSADDVQQRAEGDRREVDPPIQVETATWSKAGQLDWWVKERQESFGRVRGADCRQRWFRAVDLRPASLTAMTCWSPLMPMTTRGLALRGARIGTVIAEQQVHSLLGDAVD